MGGDTIKYLTCNSDAFRVTMVDNTWNRLLLDDDKVADAAARSFVVSGCKAGCEQPELCYNDSVICTV